MLISTALKCILYILKGSYHMLMFQYHSLGSSLLDYMKYYMKILLNSFPILSEKGCLNWAKYGNTFKWPSYPLLSETKSHRTEHESTCK